MDEQDDRSYAPWSRDEVVLITGLLILTLAARLFLSGAGTLSGDMAYWMRWGHQLTSAPLDTFYARTGADYLPIYPYILLAITRVYDPVAHLFALAGLPFPHDTLYKLPAILADTLTVWLLYRAVRRWKGIPTAGIVAYAYAVNPAIIADSARWGQVDSVPACLMLAALLYFLDQRPVVSGILLALSVLTKPTALVLVPVMAIFWLRRRLLGPLLVLGAASLVTSLLVIWPFIPAGLNVTQFILQRFLVTTSTWSYATMNAFNFWALQQHNLLRVPDTHIWLGLPEHTWGWLFMAAFETIACILAMAPPARRPLVQARLLLPVGSVVVCAFFVVLTRIHERHLLPTLPLLALTSAIAPEFWPLYIWFSVAYLLNLHFSAPGIFALHEPFLGPNEVSLVSGANVGALLLLVALAALRTLHTMHANV
jgi:dolichyl-phosphate-mannose-protein mannosyltransferase